MDELWKYLTVFFLSGLKFIFGPTLGLSYGLPAVITALLTACGMMIPVYLLTYLGDSLRHWTERFRTKNRKIFSKKSRRFVRIWKRYGIKGVAFLSPILLTPIGGAFVANLFGGHKATIIRWFWVSGLFWGFVITFVVKYAYWIVREIAVM